MEHNRSWHDPVVEIYGNLITPGTRCSAEAYDLANRRWYRLDIDAEVRDDDWMSSLVTTHLREYFAVHGEAPPWNTIKTTRSGSPVAFTIEPLDRVGRPLMESMSYGSAPTNKLHTTTFDELEDLSYISRAADRCTWQSRDCVFKRIEFDVDFDTLGDEIRVREALIRAMELGNKKNNNKSNTGEVNAEMIRRFLVVPVLAVVVGTSPPWKMGTVAGILTPYSGPDLEILARDNNDDLPITESQLWDLVRGVHELKKLGIQHGDIKYWNTVLQPPSPPPPPPPPSKQDAAAAAAADDDDNTSAKLLLIDLGTEAPDYDGDAAALATLLLWCLEHASHLRENEAAKERICAAAAALAGGDFEAALRGLDLHRG